MLELLLTTAVFAAAILSLRGRASSETPEGRDATDLPCPWCEAATAEGDAHCPSCGRMFGSDGRVSDARQPAHN